MSVPETTIAGDAFQVRIVGGECVGKSQLENRVGRFKL